MYDENKLEQLFIAKTETEWQMFDIARPITKTSPIYKLLDTILKNRLWKEITRLNKMTVEQTDFVPQIGTEINILRITE